MSQTKVLVVEDRENWRLSFCDLLADMGYAVLEAKCGKDFCALAEDADVIVLDISMPMEPGSIESKTTGLEVLIELQKKYTRAIALQNPIVRSMWLREDFTGTRFEEARIPEGYWVSRNLPTAELLDLIRSVESKSSEGVS